MTPEEYKKLSVKEFTQAAKIYDSGHAGIYEMWQGRLSADPG